MSSWPAETWLGHPVLLTQNSELDKSESSVSLLRLAGLSLKLGPEGWLGFCASLVWRWASGRKHSFCCPAPCCYLAGWS